MIQYIELNQLSYNCHTCLYLVKVVLFENPELNYHFNMNMDQSTRAIPTICTCKNVIWIFPTQPMKCPL